MTSKKILAGAAAIGALGLLLAAPANAQSYAFGYSGYDGAETLQLSTTAGPVVLNTNGDQGWWSATFANEVGNTNYFVGDPVGDGTKLNDFFMFALAGLNGATVTGATLSVTQYNVAAPLTLRLGDASALANAGELLPTGATSAAIFQALGVGGFGDFALTPGYSGAQLDFALNGAAINAINQDIANGDSYFAIGGSVSGVPEPTTWAMLILGLGAIGVSLRQRKAALAA